MTYILRIGPWHVGPFDTHIAATTFAEQHGCDDYTMIPIADPAAGFNPCWRLQPDRVDSARSVHSSVQACH